MLFADLVYCCKFAFVDIFADGLGFNLVSVLFPEFCGSSLDSHHGYVVEYGKDRDVDLGKLRGSFIMGLFLVSYIWTGGTSKFCFLILGFHVDDSEVSLNVCLGKQFNGGELFFRGVRCDNHVNSVSSEKVLVKPTIKHSVPFMTVHVNPNDVYSGFRM